MSPVSISECVDWFKNCEFVAGTPKRISPEIRSFCEQIDANPPAFVEVTPAAEAEFMRCFKNVANVIDDGSGEMQAGWIIWELPGVYLCAERHAVVRYGDQFVDVTPQPDGQRRILFAPTVDLPTGISVPCRYMPLADHPLIHRYVTLAERNQLLLGNGAFNSVEFRQNDAEGAKCIRMFQVIKQKKRSRADERALKRKKKAKNRIAHRSRR